MSSLKGKIDTAFGKAKEKVGYVIGSDKMQAEGAAQAVRGKAESAVSEKADANRKESTTKCRRFENFPRITASS